MFRFSDLIQCGVIECVPNSKSRDQLGKQTQVSLKQYFCSMYGHEDSLPYQDVSSTFDPIQINLSLSLSPGSS